MNIIKVQNGLNIARILAEGLEEWKKAGWIQCLDEPKKVTPRKRSTDENS